jgi:very-short-patch-repair endonuclease
MSFHTPISSTAVVPITYQQAREQGLTDGQLRNQIFASPFRGVRSVSPSPMWTMRSAAQAYQLLLPEGGVFSHSTAAAIHGMPLPSRLGGSRLLHVASPPHVRAREGRGVIGHRLILRDDEVAWADGLLCTSIERTWRDLATLVDVADLVAAGDHLLWFEHPRTSVELLVRTVEAASGSRGVLKLRAALLLLNERSQSPKETQTRLIVVASRLPTVRANVEIRVGSTERLIRIDLGFERYRLGLEYEGDHHRTDRAQWRKDVRRIEDLAEEGWEVMRITDDDLIDDERLVARIARRLSARGWHDPWSPR